MSLKPLASSKLLPVWGGLVVLTAFVLFSDFGRGVVNPGRLANLRQRAFGCIRVGCGTALLMQLSRF